MACAAKVDVVRGVASRVGAAAKREPCAEAAAGRSVSAGRDNVVAAFKL